MPQHSPPISANSILRTTVLEHSPGQGASQSVHYDWLFALDDPPTRLLRTIRCPQSPHQRAIGSPMSIDPAPDHRIRYLDYEGPIGPGPNGEDRGCVRMVAQGTYEFLNEQRLAAGQASEICVTWFDTSSQSADHRQVSSIQIWLIDLSKLRAIRTT